MTNLYYPLNNLSEDNELPDVVVTVPPKPVLSRDPSLYPRIYEEPINFSYYLYCVEQMTDPDKWSYVELDSFQRTIDHYEKTSWLCYPYANHPCLEEKQGQDELLLEEDGLAIPVITRHLTLLEQYVQHMPNGEVHDFIGNVLTTIDQNIPSEERLSIFKSIQKEYEQANKV